MSQIRPFKLDVPKTEIEDLQQRLKSARWPESETVEDWTQGLPVLGK